MLFPQIDSYYSLVPLCVRVVVLIFSKKYVMNLWFINYVVVFIIRMRVVLSCSGV